jgi:hypothetical protein
MKTIQPKSFNFVGPWIKAEHYMLPPLPRLFEVRGLIDRKEYFVIYAPSQSGKTTGAEEEVQRINDEGQYYAIYCSLEFLGFFNDEDWAMKKLVVILTVALKNSKVEALEKIEKDAEFMANLKAKSDFKSYPAKSFLSALCQRLDKDLVIFFDDVDKLGDRVRLSFLFQLKTGYLERANIPFPRSIALIGERNVSKSVIKISEDSVPSATDGWFNIISKAIALANFTEEEVKALYGQHTEATGQVFEGQAVQRAWYWSEGQPRLVNTLASQAVEIILANDYSKNITSQHIDESAEYLISQGDLYINHFLQILSETRTNRFIFPLLSASAQVPIKPDPKEDLEMFNDDFRFCLELGVLKKDPRLRLANPIVANSIVRYLNAYDDFYLSRELIGKWMDGQEIDLTGLLKGFQKFWMRNSAEYIESPDYIVILLLSSFLQHVVGGRALVIHEFGYGLGFSDIVVRFSERSYLIELENKDNRRSWEQSRPELLAYMDRLQINEGWLVVFDRKSEKRWTEILTWNTGARPRGQMIHVVGC